MTLSAGRLRRYVRDKIGRFARTNYSGAIARLQKSSQSRKDAKAREEVKSMGYRIAPGYHHIQINRDPSKPHIIATFQDSKGRPQRIEAKGYRSTQDEKKFARGELFVNKHEEMMRKIVADTKHSDEARALYLIAKTGFRAGGEGDGKADKKAYGAANMLSSHVKVSGITSTFNFTGKKGVEQNHVVHDSLIASFFTGKSGRVFNTTDAKILKYVKQFHPEFKTKDFRTHVATSTALEHVNKITPPKNKKEYNAKVMEVATIVSQKLGNTPAMAKNSYIDPAVFKRWENGI